MNELLRVEGLRTQFKTKKGMITAIDKVDFTIHSGEILGIVGESGCGKSVTSLSILSLLPENGIVSDGKIIMDDVDLLTLKEEQMCEIRGNKIAMIFQDPLTSLNPTMSIGKQMMEPFMIHQGYDKNTAREKALEMLRNVGIPSPEKRMNEYPHNLSGGMRQRVMIAMALSCNPKLLIADEPTTALDVSIQAQILELMHQLRNNMGTAIMLITHDMGVIAEMADNVLIMYAGRGVEYAKAEDVFKNPKHPYTKGLLESVPRLDKDVEELNTIEGTVPNQYNMPEGCSFHPRCKMTTEECRKSKPEQYKSDNTYVSCFLYK